MRKLYSEDLTYSEVMDMLHTSEDIIFLHTYEEKTTRRIGDKVYIIDQEDSFEDDSFIIAHYKPTTLKVVMYDLEDHWEA